MIISVQKAIELLKAQQIVAMPTETVYGLAASIASTSALEQVFATKKRPFFDPLIVHVTGAEQAKTLVSHWPSYADELAKAFWPGPLTLVLPKNKKISDLITAGLEQVGLRVPAHPMALQLIEAVGPLAAPSANLFTRTSPTEAAHVEDEFQAQVPVVDGGPCQVGIESTVIGLFPNEIKIYRPGAISKEQLASVVGSKLSIDYATSPVAPGQIKHHYMPHTPLAITSDVSLLPAELRAKKHTVWKMENNPQLVARKLYSQMRSMDKQSDLLVFLIDAETFHSESWAGIRNRLEKAASFNFLTGRT